jgi:nicotinate-nucleotide adenylyltransferase
MAGGDDFHRRKNSGLIFFANALKDPADFGIIIAPTYSPEILHAVTAPLIAAQDFPSFTDREILGGIRWHTTGRWGMTVFEAIVFLADYIEPSRTHEKCITVRHELYNRLSTAQSAFEKEKALNAAVLSVLNNTIFYLLKKGVIIDPDTVSARNYYLSEKEL